jgi:hypothetical protein
MSRDVTDYLRDILENIDKKLQEDEDNSSFASIY